jgi:membrane protein DedA with SNARE-associated domain
MPWQRVFAFASTYGYTFLFAASIAENIFLLGFVVPGDIAVVIGGALAARGYLHPVKATLVVVAGVVVGSCLSFWLGRRGGPALLERWAARFSRHRKEKTLTAEDYFRAHGAKTVFLASFVAGLKNTVPAVAGAANMGFSRFLVYSAAGSTVRSIALVALGYMFGANIERAIGAAGSLNGWVFFALVAMVVALLLARRAQSRRRLRQAGAKSQDRVDREPTP